MIPVDLGNKILSKQNNKNIAYKNTLKLAEMC